MHADNRDRIWDLEYRLDKHFEGLQSAIDERDRLALDAAWGLVEPATKLASFQAACALFVILHVLEVPVGWGLAAALANYFLMNFRSTRNIRVQWAQEKDRLARLPKWTPHDAA